MATLTDNMKELIQSGRCLIATSSIEGWPNVGPKGSVRVVDDTTIAFGELTARQTYSNLKENPKVAIAVVDYEKREGYRFVGTASLETSGDLYDVFVQRYRKMNLPPPAAAVRVKLEAVYSLSGKNAGVKIS